MKKTSTSKQTRVQAARPKRNIRSANGANDADHTAGDLALAEAPGQTGTDMRTAVLAEDCALPSEAGQVHDATTLQGRIERISGTAIAGWVWDPEAPDKRVRLELVDGKTCLKTTVAAEDRADLAQLGCGDGRHGFTLQLEQGLLPEGRYSLTLRCADTGYEIPGSPIAFRSVWTIPPEPCVAAVNSEVSCRGFVEQITEVAVLGWMIDCSRISRRCTVALREGSRILVEKVASDFRADLLEAGVGRRPLWVPVADPRFRF